jgi:predicted DNA repair protein MutK
MLPDDISMMGKLAAKKTAGVLGDDLLNAQQVTGVRANRELPVVWAVKGVLLNRRSPRAAGTADQRLYPVGHYPLLMIGGAFSVLKGAEKILQYA